jgi:hypothetical protein
MGVAKTREDNHHRWMRVGRPESQLSASRIAATEEGVPAPFGGLVSLDLINACNEPNKTEHETTNGRSIHYGNGRRVPAFYGIERNSSWLSSVLLGRGAIEITSPLAAGGWQRALQVDPRNGLLPLGR